MIKTLDSITNKGIFSLILNLDSGGVIIDSKDVSECYFIEDIFSYCLTGKVIIYDRYGIMEYGPLTGNETVVLSYGVEEDRELTLNISKITKITQGGVQDATAAQQIEMILVDPLFEQLTHMKFSRSWTDTKISDIIKHIFINMIGIENEFLNIEDTENKISFIMPYWTPMQTIKYLLKRSRSAATDTSGYLCFMNTNEKPVINMKTFNSLFSNNSYLDPENYVFEDINQVRENKIFEWWINGLDRFSMRGMRGGHWKGYDHTRKKFLDVSYQYTDGIDETTILGKKSLFTDISSDVTTYDMLGDNDEEIIKNRLYDGWVRRYSMQQVLNIIVKGFERRYAGMQIEIEWPGNERERTKSFNKQLKGKWLIKSITHQLLGGETMSYRQRLVLLKNGFEDSDMKDLVAASKMNLYSDNTTVRTGS